MTPYYAQSELDDDTVTPTAADCFVLACTMFRASGVATWFTVGNDAIGRRTPASLLDTRAGRERVYALLSALAEGRCQ